MQSWYSTPSLCAAKTKRRNDASEMLWTDTTKKRQLAGRQDRILMPLNKGETNVQTKQSRDEEKESIIAKKKCLNHISSRLISIPSHPFIHERVSASP